MHRDPPYLSAILDIHINIFNDLCSIFISVYLHIHTILYVFSGSALFYHIFVFSFGYFYY